MASITYLGEIDGIPDSSRMHDFECFRQNDSRIGRVDDSLLLE